MALFLHSPFVSNVKDECNECSNTGGCGYKGHVLVPKLLQAGHDVTVLG